MNNSDDGGNNNYGVDANKDDDVMSGVEQPIEENASAPLVECVMAPLVMWGACVVPHAHP